jgi:Flp pilus assembly protein TadG
MRPVKRPLSALLVQDDGAIGVVTAILLPVMILVLGLVLDISYGYAARSQLQSAADASVLAGALSLGQDDATVRDNAKAIAVLNMPAAKYGTVLADADIQTGKWNSTTRVFTPGGSQKNAVQVVARRASNNANALPTFFARFAGLDSLDVNVRATAVISIRDYCLLTLSNSATGIVAHGVPNANLPCNVFSNSNMRCTGHNLGAPFGDSAMTNNGCGVIQTSNVPPISDPYAALASKIPANTCSSYPQEPTKKKDPPLPATNQLFGNVSYASPKIFCGDVQLTANVTVTGAQNLIVIENGQLDTNGYTFQTGAGAGATIVFSGTAGSYTHTPTGGGILDISSPTSGNWSGVAMYADPKMTSPTYGTLDISEAGASPSWNISGLAYFPKSDITLKGAVGKATNGFSCFVLVMNTLLIAGTGNILNEGQCPQQGLPPPTNPTFAKARLVG